MHYPLSESPGFPLRRVFEQSPCLHHGATAQEHNQQEHRHLRLSYKLVSIYCPEIVRCRKATQFSWATYVFSSLFTIHLFSCGASSSGNNMLGNRFTFRLIVKQFFVALVVNDEMLECAAFHQRSSILS